MVVVRERNARIAVTRPNWRDPVRAEYSFKTGIVTARDGSEHREATRQTARVAFQFTTLLTRPGIARHMSDVAGQQDGQIVVRAEWAGTVLSAAHAAGGSDIIVADTPGWLVPGALIVITSDTNEDLFTVSAVAGNTVTLADVAIRDYPAGAKVHLAYWCRAGGKIDFQAETSGLWRGNVRYDVIPPHGGSPTIKKASYGYSYRELFIKRPNWRERPRISFVQDRDILDPGFGLVDVLAPRAADSAITRFVYTGLSREESNRLIDFFLRHKGRRSSFWMPTWQRDILPSATPLALANSFRVDGEDFRNVFKGHPVYQSMIAFFPDGTWQVNKIKNIDGTTNSNVRGVWDWRQPITPDTEIMWLTRCRFESDTLVVRWITDSIAEMEFSVRTLPADVAPDYPISAEFSVLRGQVEPFGMGDLLIKDANPTTIGRVIDLFEYGVTQEEIDSGQVKALSRWTGLYQTGSPPTDDTTTVELNIDFHSAEPVNHYDHLVSPLPGDVVSFSASQTGAFLAELAPVTVPPGARYVQFRSDYWTNTGETLSNYETLWAVGRVL